MVLIFVFKLNARFPLKKKVIPFKRDSQANHINMLWCYTKWVPRRKPPFNNKRLNSLNSEKEYPTETILNTFSGIHFFLNKNKNNKHQIKFNSQATNKSVVFNRRLGENKRIGKPYSFAKVRLWWLPKMWTTQNTQTKVFNNWSFSNPISISTNHDLLDERIAKKKKNDSNQLTFPCMGFNIFYHTMLL